MLILGTKEPAIALKHTYEKYIGRNKNRGQQSALFIRVDKVQVWPSWK
jgi:hypothetical protein